MGNGNALGGLIGLGIGLAVTHEILHHTHHLHRVRRNLKRRKRRYYYYD
jgi:hypothetical protein